MEEAPAYYALTRKAFDRLAPFYDLITLPLVRVRERVVDLAHAGPGSTVLDVATGTGQQALAFAKRGYAVTGVDLTESMLEIARKHDKDGLVIFGAGDATHLPFREHSFDVTCVSFALHDMPFAIRTQVVGEMVRVTKTRGTIIIVDYDLPRDKISKGLIYRFMTLYEGEYYREFIASDLHALLNTAGIDIEGEHSILLGAGRILTAAKNHGPTRYP